MAIRVLVVDDSLTVRKRLIEVLAAAGDLEVVGEAEDGKRAIELCERLRPDVVTLDMMLPVMSGLAATEYIMAYCPTPILVVSASLNRGELFETYQALAAGAVDVLDKPTGEERDDRWNQRFVAAVRLLSRLKVITHLRGRLGARAGTRLAASPVPGGPSGPARLIAIGGSTGAPSAVLDILRGLPASFPLPILVVVHLSEVFAPAFADWLDGQSPLRVAYARDGEPLPPPGHGRVLMAPARRHLVFGEGRLWLSDEPERHSCKPSVDVLFESLARGGAPSCLACLLTGMGKDGAEGLLALRRSGAQTIAQDEATSVVFGMPREAIALGAAQRVLPLERIAPALLEAGVPRRGAP